MFYGLASGAVQVPGIEVDQVLSDIESLNQAAFEGRYEVTAVSFHAYAHLLDRYALLPHGASMGDRYGPILVAREPLGGSSLAGVKVGVPGRLTSAFLTLQLYDPSFDFEIIPFDEIQPAVLAGRVDAGLLIHEGQLTYASDGLRKIVDLGEWWFDRTGGLPLPLGGNVIRRDLGSEPVPHLTTATLAGVRGEPATAAERETRARSDALIAELRAADIVVIGAPMYNFGIPTSLRSWFDHVLRAGETFRYTSAGPEGLLAGKRAIVVEPRGGAYGDGPAKAADFQEPYLRHLLGFIGLTDVTFVHAEKIGFGPEARAAALASAKARIAALAQPALSNAA